MPADTHSENNLDEDTAPRRAITRPMKLRLTRMDDSSTNGSQSSNAAAQAATPQQQEPFAAATEQITPSPTHEQFNNFGAAPYQEQSYREHVTRPLPAYRAAAPYNGSPYPSYPPYPT